MTKLKHVGYFDLINDNKDIQFVVDNAEAMVLTYNVYCIHAGPMYLHLGGTSSALGPTLKNYARWSFEPKNGETFYRVQRMIRDQLFLGCRVTVDAISHEDELKYAYGAIAAIRRRAEEQRHLIESWLGIK